MIYRKFILFIIVICLTSCQQKSSKIRQPVLQGIWKKHGYGQIIQISKSNIDFYDITQKSCLPVKTVSLKNIREFGEIVSVTDDTLLMKSGINRYQFIRLKALPKFCNIHSEKALKNPVYNFEVFWNTFNENYAFFGKRKIKWDQIYRDYRPKISEQTTDQELYNLLNEIIGKFKDGHITLDAPKSVVEGKAKDGGKEDGNSVSKIPEVSPLKLRNAILQRYLTAPNFSGRDLYGKGLLSWGITKENVGYIQINWMLFFRDYKIADSLKGDDYAGLYFQKATGNPLHMIEEVEQARKIMDRAIMALKDVNGIILDIRLNGGGYDAVALEILNHFASKKTLAFSKQTWLGTKFSEPVPIYLSPSKKIFSGPVALLTSHSTASAAEIMAMASMGLKNFIRIGSSTEGIFSDMLEKKLPNGWSFSLSNEVYMNSSDENFENTGIPTNIQMFYPNEGNKFRYSVLKNIREGDPAVDSAISLLYASKTNP